MEIEEKVQLLNNLNTKKLIQDIQEQENKLETLLLAEAKFRSENVGYLASYGDDCTQVKAILADLALEPPVEADGKKATVAKVESWLRQQRSTKPTLVEAIWYQNQVTFQCENNRVAIEMAKKRMESLKGLLGLRTAQIEFLRE